MYLSVLSIVYEPNPHRGRVKIVLWELYDAKYQSLVSIARQARDFIRLALIRAVHSVDRRESRQLILVKLHVAFHYAPILYDLAL